MAPVEPSEAVLAPSLAPNRNTISLEVSPEWDAINHDFKDGVFKLGYSRALGNGFNWGTSGRHLDRAGSDASHQTALETTLGYGWKPSDMLSVSLRSGIGYVWDQKAASSELSATDWAYFSLNAGLNVKLDSHWTWNALSVRYRNAFKGGWETPNASTGVTYSIDRQNSIFAKTSYSWKNGKDDKISAGFGYKFGF